MFTTEIALENTLEILRNTQEFQFHLTGSRFFGVSNASSDWDFFVQDNENIRHFLVNHGFKIHSRTIYKDSNTVEVYRKHESHYHFDIQIVKDSEMKSKVQRALYNILPRTRPSIEDWNMAFEIYKQLTK